MILYKAYWQDPNHGRCQRWFANRQAATGFLKSNRRFYTAVPIDIEPCGVEEVLIQPSRKGMVDWLNRNFVTDNG